MRATIKAARVRAILYDARTDRDITDALRRHCIRYRYSTTGGVFHVVVPCIGGALRVFVTADRSVPPVVVPCSPARSGVVPVRTAPVYRNYDI